MGTYMLQRLLAGVPVIIVVGLITFFLLHLAPGDPAVIMAGEEATPEQVAEVRRALGLDKPVMEQFVHWVGRLASGDLGTSIFSQKSIGSLIAPRIQPTLSLAILSLSISILVGVSLGALAAWKAGHLLDRLVMFIAVLGFAMPVFWLGFLLIWAFAVNLRIFPAVGFVPISDGVIPFLRSMTLPALANGFPGIALMARMTRSSMMEVLREDYIRTARAKGLSEIVVYVRHAFKNASIPVVTLIGLVFGALIGGTVVTESIFAIPGLGRLTIDAVVRRDYPIVQAMLMIVALLYVLVNLVVDLTYAFLDPRIRY
jgi:peptide/nickel transport system permease protein